MVKFCARVNGSDIYRVDFEKEEFEPIGYCSNIDYRYLIPEDGILEITDKDGNKKTIEVKKHDVLFKMYSITDNFEDREYIVINNPELKDYYRRMTEKLEADKKAREAVSGEKVCCDCGSIGEK